MKLSSAKLVSTLVSVCLLGLGACKKEDPLEQLLQREGAEGQANNADALLNNLAVQAPPSGMPMELPMPPTTGGEGGGGGEPAEPAVIITGTILETMDASNYTYMRLKFADGKEDWAAVTKTPVKVGQSVRVAQSMVMQEFHSNALARTFARIIFGNVVATSDSPAAPPPAAQIAGKPLPPGHPAVGGAPQVAAPAGNAAPQEEGAVIVGTVLETMDASTYTYVRFKNAAGEENWAAINKTPIQVGGTIKLRSSVVMHDFVSASLKRTFPHIIFATLLN